MMKLFVIAVLFLSFGNLQAQDSAKFEFNDAIFVVGQEKNVEIRYTYCAPFGSSVFDADILDSIRVFLLSQTSIKVSNTHHTDTRGSANANLELSKRRAAGIKAEIVKLGVSEDRVIAIGKGETEPIHSEEEINQYKQTNQEKFEQLHQINRRTIIRITHI